MKKPFFLLLPLLGLALTGCPANSLKSGAAESGAADGKPDILHAALDTTVAPGDDFFAYANGTWIKNNPIPASESSMGIGKKVQDEIYARLRQTSMAAADAKAAAGSNQQKIGDFWAVGMDSVQADRLGAAPLKPELDRIAAMHSVAEVPGVVAHEIRLGVNALIGPRVGQDDKNSDKMALYLRQAGLGLPNRDYYFNTDSRTKNIRAEYLRHVANTFRLLGQDAATAQANAAQVMALETTLAQVVAQARSPARPLRQLPQDEYHATRQAHARHQLENLAEPVGDHRGHRDCGPARVLPDRGPAAENPAAQCLAGPTSPGT